MGHARGPKGCPHCHSLCQLQLPEDLQGFVGFSMSRVGLLEPSGLHSHPFICQQKGTGLRLPFFNFLLPRISEWSPAQPNPR